MGSNRFALLPCLELLCTNMLSEIAKSGPSTETCVAMTTCKSDIFVDRVIRTLRQCKCSQPAILRFKVAAAMHRKTDSSLGTLGRPQGPRTPSNTHAFPWEPRDDDGGAASRRRSIRPLKIRSSTTAVRTKYYRSPPTVGLRFPWRNSTLWTLCSLRALSYYALCSNLR